MTPCSCQQLPAGQHFLFPPDQLIP